MDAGRRDRADGGGGACGGATGTTEAPARANAPTTRRGLLAATAGVLGSVGAGCLGGLPGAGEPTPSPVESLPAPVLGSADAPVTVMAFEDFACPHCGRFALEVLPRIVDEYVADDRARFEYHDFPIPVDPTWSWQAPSAARAVQDAEGAVAFFDYAERLYEHMGSYDPALIADLAEEVGANGETVRRAATTERYRPVIEADRAHGRELGVDGTPAVFVDGERLPDYSFDTVAAAIESHL